MTSGVRTATVYPRRGTVILMSIVLTAPTNLIAVKTVYIYFFKINVWLLDIFIVQ